MDKIILKEPFFSDNSYTIKIIFQYKKAKKKQYRARTEMYVNILDSY